MYSKLDKEYIRNNDAGLRNFFSTGWHAIYLIFYVVSVVLIPLTPIGGKGTILNTLSKAFILLLFTGHFFFSKKKSETINLLSFLACALYIIGQLTSIMFEGNISSLVNMITSVLMLFTLLFELPRIKVHWDEIQKILKLFVLFTVITCLWNIIMNADVILSLSFINNVYYNMYSFFDNKNTYGIFLFAGLGSNIYLMFFNNKKIYKLSFILILFSIIISMSRTSFLSSILFLTVGYFFVSLQKTSKIVNIFVICLVILLSITLIGGINEYVFNILLRTEVESFRQPIYKAALKLFQQRPIIGFGESAFGESLKKLCGNEYTHNGYLTVLLSGGIVYFIAYVFIIVKAISNAWNIRKVHLNLGSYILAFLIATLVYSMGESVVLLQTAASNFSVSLFAVVVPQLILNIIKDE